MSDLNNPVSETEFFNYYDLFIQSQCNILAYFLLIHVIENFNLGG